MCLVCIGINQLIMDHHLSLKPICCDIRIKGIVGEASNDNIYKMNKLLHRCLPNFRQ